MVGFDVQSRSIDVLEQVASDSNVIKFEKEEKKQIFFYWLNTTYVCVFYECAIEMASNGHVELHTR